MKQECLLIIFGLMSTLVINSINAQVKIGDNPKNVNLHALLELESKDQGLLLPRLTQAQRDTAFGIDVPEGLLIFNIDQGALEVFNSMEGWVTLGTSEAPSSTLELTHDHQLILNGKSRVNLTHYYNVNQQLTLSGNVLSLTDGGRVDLSSLTISSTAVGTSNSQEFSEYNTSSQTLSLTKLGNLTQTSLKLDGGNEIILLASNGIEFYATPTSLNIIGSNKNGAFSTQDNVTSNALGDVFSDDFVFGSDQLDNKTGGDDDARVLFDKSKGAFRAGRDGNNSWDESKRGKYSIGLGYNPEADADRSIALGNSIITTAYAETVLGSYNEHFIGANGSSWVDTDPLLTIGNGKSSREKSTALTLLKNGNMGVGIMKPTEKIEVMGVVSATEFSGKSITFNGAGLFTTVSNSLTELVAFDSAGNESIISPHNFSLIGSPSEAMAWSFYSKNIHKNQQVNVDMMKLVRLVEGLSGHKLVHLADLDGNAVENQPQEKVVQLKKEIESLKTQNRVYQEILVDLLKRVEGLEHKTLFLEEIANQYCNIERCIGVKP